MPKLQTKLRGPLKMPIRQYILCFVGRAFLYNLVNKTNLAHKLFLVYLSVSTFFERYGSIIGRNNCVFATLGAYYSVWMTAWYAGCIPCIPDSHSHRITSNKCRKSTVVSLDDGFIVVRNM